MKQSGKNLGNDEYAFFCPKHGARADRATGQLTINVANDKFHCWSCDFKGKNLLFLFPRGSPEWKEYTAELPEFKKKEKEPERQFDQPTIPEDFRTLSKEWHGPYYSAAMGYLEKRGIGKEEILKWKLGYCENGPYRNRIIIPSFDEHGHLNFITGRAFYESKSRYWNGNFCKDIIFNDYLIDWNKPVVITEGPFDAFKADENAIALQGNLLTTNTKLFSKIVLSGVDVFFAMDEDAFQKQLGIIAKLVSYGTGCSYVPLDGKKDVGEMTKEQFRSAKRRSVLVRSDLDLLKLRIRA